MSVLTDPMVLEAIKVFGLVGSGFLAAVFARWRYKIADRNLLQEQFKAAASDLAKERSRRIKPSGELRVSCVVMLGKVARQDPKGYHVAVMRIFEILLTWTTVFYGRREVVDPEANDVIEVIRFVESRSEKQKRIERKEGYTFRLRKESPFYIGKDGRLYLHDRVLPLVTEEMKERGIDSQFLSERHPDAYRESRSTHQGLTK